MRTGSVFLFCTLLAGIMVSGCAPRYTYSKSGTNSTQSTQDNYQCQKENMYIYTSYSGELLIQNRRVDRNGWKMCMRGRGYTVEAGGSSSYTPQTKYISPSYNHVWCASKQHGVFSPPDAKTCQIFGGTVFGTENQAKSGYQQMSGD